MLASLSSPAASTLSRLKPRWRASWHLSTRLSLAFGLVLGLLLLITVMALNRMQLIDTLSSSVVEEHNHRIAIAQAMMNAVNEVSVAMVGVGLVVDDADAQEQTKLLTRAVAQYDDARKQFGELPGATTTERATLNAVDTVAAEARLRIDDIQSMLGNSATNAANALRRTDPRPLQHDWLGRIAGLVAQETGAGQSKYAEAKSAYLSARRLLIIVAGLAIALASLAVTLLLRSVTRPLALAIAHARRIAGGDLTGSIVSERADETGELLDALSSMQEQLRGLVDEIGRSANGIALASSEIAQGNLDLSSRTERAAGDLQSTASSVEQLASVVRHAAAAAGQADALAGVAEAAARQGGTAVGKVVEVMDEIHAGARKIADITEVIDSIAFQTNILALNASVEAAQAGDRGRGFAIVASEVRSLAQRSATAGRDIKALVEHSLGNAANGARLARDAGTTMEEIVASVRRTALMIGEVSTAAGQQSTGIEQVNASVARLDEMTQRNAALVEQSAAAAQGLAQQSSRLEELVGVFRVKDRMS